MLLINAEEIKTNIEKQLGCIECVKKATFHLIHKFIEWSDIRLVNIIQEILSKPPEQIPDAF